VTRNETDTSRKRNNGRKQYKGGEHIHIAVTRNFADMATEFFTFCKTYNFNPADVIRSNIGSWLEKQGKLQEQYTTLCIERLHAVEEAKKNKDDEDELTWAEAQASMAFQVAGTIGVDPNWLRAMASSDTPFEGLRQYPPDVVIENDAFNRISVRALVPVPEPNESRTQAWELYGERFEIMEEEEGEGKRVKVTSADRELEGRT